MKNWGKVLFLSAGLHLSLCPAPAQAGGDKDPPHADSDAEPARSGSDNEPPRADEHIVAAGADGRAAYAEHLFREGVKLMKSDNCPQAIAKFLSSQQIDPSSGTLVNLATCYARLGRNASAWHTYRRAAAAAASEGRDELREHVYKVISALAPTLTKLKVVPPRGATAMAVTLNGETLGDDDGLPIALDPGENIVEATVSGRPPWRRTVNATEVGATIVIEVPEASAVRDVGDDGARTNWRTAAVIVGGVGVAGMVTGLVVGLSAKSSYDDSAQFCRDNRCNSTGHDLREDAVGKATLSTYAVGLGTIAVAGGAVLWFASPSRSNQRVGMSVWIPTERASFGLSLKGPL